MSSIANKTSYPKIALGQINPLIGDLKYNFEKITKQIEKAKKEGINLIIFPELAILGYPPKDILLKHGLMEQLDYYISELAIYTDNNFAIVLGSISANNEYGKKFFNSVICIADGKVQQVSHKNLLPTYDVFDETRYFKAATQVETWDFMGFKFGLSICEDIWIEAYPNLYSRNPIDEIIAAGAEILINVAASPFNLGKSFERHELLQSTAKKYNCPILYVNQVGANDHLIFDGNSLVVDKDGNLIAKGKDFDEDLISIDSQELFDSKAGKSITLKNTNTNFFDIDDDSLDELLKAICLGIKDYVAKCGFKKVLLGLSGGIDSALVAALAAKAIGPENVYAFMLSSQFTSEESFNDARSLAKNLGVNYEEISIEELHASSRKLIKGLSPLADENLQPRIRANVLMAYSNTLGALLLATSNKSEVAVGYSTIYGDSAGAIAPIGDILKSVVYKLAEYINKKFAKEDKAGGGYIPVNILKKEPSAELRPNQKDSDSLPEYSLLDQIIFKYIEEFKSIKQIIDEGFDSDLVKRVLNLIDHNEYKRMQSAPALKVGGKAFGVGRRMPIAQGFKHK